MKRLLNYLLIGTLVFSTFILPSNSNVSAMADNSITEENEDSYRQAFESNGVQYFFEDTDQYTITITKALNGKQSIVYKDKLNNNDDIVYFYDDLGTTNKNISVNSIETNPEITSLNVADAKALENIKKNVLNNEVKLEEKSMKDFGEVTYYTESESDSILEQEQ